MLDEVHGDGVPRFLRDRELLESSVRLVSRGLGSPAGRTRLTVVLDESPDTGPGILSSHQLEGLVETVMSGERVVVLVPEYAESEIGDVQNVNPVVEEKKT